MEELEQLVLGVIAAGDLSALLSGSLEADVRAGLAGVRGREHAAAVARRRAARMEEIREGGRRVNRAWQEHARVRGARRAVVRELRALFDSWPVADDVVRDYLDGVPGRVPVRVRRAMIERCGVNKCSVCGEGKDPLAFRSRPDHSPQTRCLACVHDAGDPLVRMLSQKCTQSAARCRKKRAEGKEGWAHDISPDLLLELFDAQEGRCALCGLVMTAIGAEVRVEQSARTKWLLGEGSNVSIDQIEPGGGYTVVNVQLTHLRCNLAKRDVPEAEFVQMCRDVAAHHTSS